MINTELLQQYIEQHQDDKDLGRHLLDAIRDGQFNIEQSPQIQILDLERHHPIHVRIKSTSTSDGMFDDTYIEPGMEALITSVQLYYDDDRPVCYTLRFDMTNFMESNKRFLEDRYYPNEQTNQLSYRKGLYNAEEAGWYDNHQITRFFGDCEALTAEQMEQTLREYLEVVE